MNQITTIAAISTPLITGGIGVIRISGPEAITIAKRVFFPFGKHDPESMKGYRTSFGTIRDKGEKIDEGILLIFRAPHSYTGEDVAEISCHGGIYVVKRVLGAVIDAGAEPAGPGEFTKRAFLNGKLDLTEAEAVADLIFSEGDASLRAAVAMKDGVLFTEAGKICGELTDIASHLSAWVDFPEEDVPEVDMANLTVSLKGILHKLQDIKKSYRLVETVKNGISCVVTGKPNTGKSTLMNCLCREDRSIVTDIPGTTRDVIEQAVELSGLMFRFADTAGIREGSDAIENEGVRRSRSKLQSADIVLAVFDPSRPFSAEDLDIIESTKRKTTIAVLNKSDLPKQADLSALEKAFDRIVSISAKSGMGMESLLEQLRLTAQSYHIDISAPFVANKRQLHCIEAAEESISRCLDALHTGYTLDVIAIDVEEAIDSLLTLTGSKASEEIIDAVFQRFCVGK